MRSKGLVDVKNLFLYMALVRSDISLFFLHLNGGEDAKLREIMPLESHGRISLTSRVLDENCKNRSARDIFGLKN